MYFIKIGNKHALPKKGAFDRPYSKTKTNKINSETRAISVALSPDGGDLHQRFFPQYNELKNFTTFSSQIHHTNRLYLPLVQLLLL